MDRFVWAVIAGFGTAFLVAGLILAPLNIDPWVGTLICFLIASPITATVLFWDEILAAFRR